MRDIQLSRGDLTRRLSALLRGPQRSLVAGEHPAKDRRGTLFRLRVRAAQADQAPSGLLACPSRIRCQAATGSCTRFLQWETQRTLFRSAGTTVCSVVKVSGVWPSNDAWPRASL
jgi:hypothetical protein